MAWGRLFVLMTALCAPAEPSPPPPAMMPENLLAAPSAAVDDVIALAGEPLGDRIRGVILTDPVSFEGDSDPTYLNEACGSLRDAGIASTFVTVPVGPERPFFADPDARRHMIETVARAAAMVQDAGGSVLIDTQSSSLFYDFRWQGYDYAEYERGDLEREARAFGHALANASCAGGANSVLLVAADDVTHAPALWFRLFAGIADGCADRMDLHLVVRQSGAPNFPSDAQSSLDAVRGMIAAHGEGRMPDSVTPWVAMGTTEREFRTRLVRAKLASRRYVVIEGPPTAWEDAVATVGLLDGFARVGPYEFGGAPAFVLRDERGGAVIAIKGTREPVQIARERGGVTVTQLLTNRAAYVEPRDGTVTVEPCVGPTLVTGLPVQDWVVPAGLWADVTFAASPTARHALRYGWLNRTGLTFSGRLEVLAPDLHIEPRAIDCAARPGETVRADGFVRSVVLTGDAVDLQLVLSAPGSKPVTRDVRLTRPPYQAWRVPLSAPLTGLSGPTYLNRDETPDVVVTTGDGEVAGYDATGRVLWERQFDATFALPAVVGYGGTRNRTILAAVDTRGILHKLDWEGDVLRSPDLGTAPAGPLVLADFHWFRGMELAVPQDAGGLRAFYATGDDLWTLPASQPPIGVCVAERAAGDYDALVAAYADRLVRIDAADGSACWEATCGRTVTAGPVSTGVGDASTIATGHADGSVSFHHVSDGSNYAHLTVADGTPVTHLAVVASAGSTPSVCASAGARVAAASPGSRRELWRIDLAAPVVHLSSGDGIVLAVLENGELCLIDASEGVVRWTMPHEGPVKTVAPCIAGHGREALAILPGTYRTLCGLRLAE